MLASHDRDFVETLTPLVDGRRVGIVGFEEFLSGSLRELFERGVEFFDLEYHVEAFNERLPRLRIIPIDQFDPFDDALAIDVGTVEAFTVGKYGLAGFEANGGMMAGHLVGDEDDIIVLSAADRGDLAYKRGDHDGRTGLFDNQLWHVSDRLP